MTNNESEQSYSLKDCPSVAGKINFYRSQVIISQAGRELSFQVGDNSRKQLEKLFFMMDGTNSVEKLQQELFSHQPEAINPILQSLDNQGLLNSNTQIQLDSGVDTMLELQELGEDLLDGKFNISQLWQSFTWLIDTS